MAPRKISEKSKLPHEIINMITQQRLRELLDYDPTTGMFTWKVKRDPRTPPGKTAGSIRSNGYSQISVDGVNYAAHRLAWLYVHGKWPPISIDHKNCVPTDNRIDNLRLATNRQNRQNLRKADRDSKSGLLGAHPVGKRWRARIKVNGVKLDLGTHATAQQAHEAYVAAKRRLHEYGTL